MHIARRTLREIHGLQFRKEVSDNWTPSIRSSPRSHPASSPHVGPSQQIRFRSHSAASRSHRHSSTKRRRCTSRTSIPEPRHTPLDMQSLIRAAPCANSSQAPAGCVGYCLASPLLHRLMRETTGAERSWFCVWGGWRVWYGG